MSFLFIRKVLLICIISIFFIFLQFETPVYNTHTIYMIDITESNNIHKTYNEYIIEDAVIVEDINENEDKKIEEYLQPAFGRILLHWHAKEKLKYDDLYSIVNYVVNKYPEDIENKDGLISLLIETIATESSFGSANKQKNGPALGIIQMTPGTFRYLRDNYIKPNPHLHSFISKFKDKKRSDIENLKINLQYQIALMIIHYMRQDVLSEDLQTINSRYFVYKNLYNTPKGKATLENFLKNVDLYLSTYYNS